MAIQQTHDSPGQYSLDVSDLNEIEVYMEGGGGGVGGANEVTTEPDRGPGGHGASATGSINTEDIDTLEMQVGGGGGGGGSGFSVVADGGDGGFPNGGRGGDATAGSDGRSDSGAGGGGGGSTELKAGDGTVLVITDGGGGGGGQEQNDSGGGGGGGGRGGSGRNGGEDGDGDGNGGDGAQADANGRADPGGGETHETLFDGSVETGGANNGDDDYDEPPGVIELEYTPVPSAPSGLEATSGDTSVTLSWVDNDDEQPARVFRDREPGVTPESTLIEEVPNGSETYEDTSAKQGIQYYYAVFAYDPENDVYSSASNETEPFITLPAPTDLTVTNVGDETVDLSWIDNAEDEEGYRIEADKDDEGEWEIVEDGLAPGTESATATGLLNGQLYGLRVIVFTEDTEEVDV